MIRVKRLPDLSGRGRVDDISINFLKLFQKKMRKFIALVCVMLMTPPFAFAQDKGNDGAKKSVPSAEVKAGKGREADGNSGKDAGAEKQGDKKKAGKAKKELSPAQKARHERRNQCNAQAGEKKGEARRQFMIACEKDLKKFNNDKKKAQQERLTSCNKQAGDKKLKDDDRKKFLGECLSAKK